MKIAVIQFPGSNCERETMLAIKRSGMEPVEYLWNAPRESLLAMDGYVLVGGFSYEDRSRAGIIAALDPIMQTIKSESETGKPVLGICNGAQILVESGLVPGLRNYQLGMALTENKRVSNGKILGTGYYNAWVHLTLSKQYQRNAFTRYLNTNSILQMPVAHAEGRFVMNEALLNELEMQGLCLFHYCDEQGHVINEFPINPNGSLHNIAAISNKLGNVMAIMPHPERTTEGDALFHSMRDYIKEAPFSQTTPLHYQPRHVKLLPYQKPDQSNECIVELFITDNEALTVQNALRSLGISVSVSRLTHWEIDCDSEESFQHIKQTGVLYNHRKEKLISSKPIQSNNTKTLLVRPIENWIGQQKRQLLNDHFSIPNIQSIKQGTLWQFTTDDQMIEPLIDSILQTNIIYNPYAHEYYDYC